MTSLTFVTESLNEQKEIVEMKVTEFQSPAGTRRLASTLMGLFVLSTMTGCALFSGPANPLVGSWDLTMESPLGTSHPTLMVAEDLTGNLNMTEPEELTIPISNTMVEGMVVSFDVTFDFQGQALAAKFGGTIDGDNITGEFVTDFGNATITGMRKE